MISSVAELRVGSGLYGGNMKASVRSASRRNWIINSCCRAFFQFCCLDPPEKQTDSRMACVLVACNEVKHLRCIRKVKGSYMQMLAVTMANQQDTGKAWGGAVSTQHGGSTEPCCNFEGPEAYLHTSGQELRGSLKEMVQGTRRTPDVNTTFFPNHIRNWTFWLKVCKSLV